MCERYTVLICRSLWMDNEPISCSSVSMFIFFKDCILSYVFKVPDLYSLFAGSKYLRKPIFIPKDPINLFDFWSRVL